ncbi:MAG TPA: CDP-glycerol glycerophosphotransferase family protein [Galbitalea sp.]|nr:CDP-glycerol glycerophosphotransferase family protein [Galbitalea sp.]
MARFTFATGNLKKVLALPLYGLGTLAGVAVPRSKKLWVFGSGSGVGEGSLALLLHTRGVDPALRLVWLTRNAADETNAKSLGIATASKRSVRGFWLTLRARVVVVTHGFGDANRFGVHGAYVVQLWHGIPFKHIHLDSPATVSIPVFSRFGVARRAIRSAYLRSARGIQLFATASPIAAARIRTAFGLPADRVVITGDPRDDILATESRDDARAKVASLLRETGLRETGLPEHVLLYAPTWRDGAEDPLIPAAADWERIIAYLDATESILLIRSHPLGAGDYSVGAELSPRIRMLGANLQGDITPLLPAVDTLITDYSSIAFDYSLIGGPMVFLAPDVLTYSSSRGSYEPFSDFTGGFEVADWTGVVELLRERDTSAATRKRMTEHTQWLAGRNFSYSEGGNTARVYDEIVARLGTCPKPSYVVPALPLTIATVELSDTAAPVLTLNGSARERPPVAVQLGGPRMYLSGALEVTGKNWTATIPLLSSRFGGPALPPPSGRYRVRFTDDHDRVLDADVVAAPIAAGMRQGLFRFTIPPFDTAVSIEIAAPLTAAEVGARNQARLQAAHRRVRRATGNSIFFESYYGQNVSSNPRGIDRAVERMLPDVDRYWSVLDGSVEVPDGATAIDEGSEAWWQARASSRALVVNDWIRKRFRKRRGQTVLQTWHGTPLKQLALDRPGVRLRAAIATRRERSHWNIMLAQNQFSAGVFRSAYAFTGPIWLEGYPRDDILVSGDAAAVRKRLGVSTTAKVVLYAPTWRDDRPGKVDHLDVAKFARDLGPDFVTLIRGHSRSMLPGVEIVADGVIDVTSYPDISELFLVADALITDYSSVMFDFSVTGKPIYFFTPDLAHYRDDLRGFYFDLLADAPGPVLTDATELASRIRAADSTEFAERYAAWRARFNPSDDGHAGERVVQRMLDEGLLDR